MFEWLWPSKNVKIKPQEVGRCLNIGKDAMNLHVTLWPAFSHFPQFAADPRVQGIRLNSAMMSAAEIDTIFRIRSQKATVPLWFDVKGMQMRIREVIPHKTHLEFVLNRPVKVKTPCTVWFKAGEDAGKCVEIVDGTRFIFDGGPSFEVRAGESIHIREDDMEVGGVTFLDYEIDKIEKVKSLGFTRWYLSYVYEQRHVDEFRNLIGRDAELVLKIENKAGLDYVANTYKPMPNTRLMAARGDLYVEIDYPHQILAACKTIIDKDNDALVGSRMLLSLVKGDVASCSDLFELSGLRAMGYKNFLLCDELCLKGGMLGAAINVFDAVRNSTSVS